jgi:uncharacterized protein
MSVPHHPLSREVFADLAAGGGGVDAIRQLAEAEQSKHMILLTGVLNAAAEDKQRPLAQAGYDVLTKVWRANRTAAETVIRHPSVAVWARRTIQACLGGPVIPGAEPGGLRAVAAAAAIHAGLDVEIDVAVIDGRVMLPTLGAAEVSGTVTTVRCGAPRAKVGPVEIPGDPQQDAPGWLGLRRVRMGTLSVPIDDLDPFRMPDVPDPAPRQASVQDWETAFGQVWPLLERVHPVVAVEVAAAVSAIVPRSRPPEGTVSTSTAEAFGVIGMSLPPDPVTCAETLAHEIQHVKLGALMGIVALTEPDDNGALYYAPWRDDPRPLRGLLQGAYAYLGVSGFWQRQRRVETGEREPDVEFAHWREATAHAVKTLLSSGRLTPRGLEFVTGMARTLSAWQEEPVPAGALRQARGAMQAHLARWESANGPVPS